MHGALAGRGRSVGVLADSLERAVVSRDHRGHLLDGRLTLISAYDPAAGFNVGHAMQRNKAIYALADAALVVNADLGNGGTWAGAVEQLQRLHFVRLYVRSAGELGEGLEGLIRLGARRWPEPASPENFRRVVLEENPPAAPAAPEQETFSFGATAGHHAPKEKQTETTDESVPHPQEANKVTPAEELFGKVRELLERLDRPKTGAEVATDLHVTKAQARHWLERLVKDGVLEKLSRPTRYSSLKERQRT
jgi:predicted Rossmann fold nucleotide-binding protein DprA/Smf involved in DNA uptake